MIERTYLTVKKKKKKKKKWKEYCNYGEFKSHLNEKIRRGQGNLQF